MDEDNPLDSYEFKRFSDYLEKNSFEFQLTAFQKNSSVVFAAGNKVRNLQYLQNFVKVKSDRKNIHPSEPFPPLPCQLTTFLSKLYKLEKVRSYASSMMSKFMDRHQVYGEGSVPPIWEAKVKLDKLPIMGPELNKKMKNSGEFSMSDVVSWSDMKFEGRSFATGPARDKIKIQGFPWTLAIRAFVQVNN